MMNINQIIGSHFSVQQRRKKPQQQQTKYKYKHSFSMNNKNMKKKQLKKPVILPASHKWRSETSVFFFFKSKRSYIGRKVTRIREKKNTHTNIELVVVFWYFLFLLFQYTKRLSTIISYNASFHKQCEYAYAYIGSHMSGRHRVYKCHGRVRARSRSHRVSQKSARARHTLR